MIFESSAKISSIEEIAYVPEKELFAIEAFDQAGPIAVARHERFIVKTPSFMTTFLALSVILYFPANPVYTGTIRCRSRTVLPLERHG